MRPSKTWTRRRAAVVLVAGIGLAGCSTQPSGGPQLGGSSGVPETGPSAAELRLDEGVKQEAVGPCAELTATTASVRTDRLPILFTNKSGKTCTVTGFPGVRLDGVDGISWDLVRRQEQAGVVTLLPGRQVTAVLNFVSQPSGGWEVRKLVVTPPNTKHTQELPWPAGPIVLQDGATRPATHIGPVTPSATAGS
jgi:hypothetical protein